MYSAMYAISRAAVITISQQPSDIAPRIFACLRVADSFFPDA
jgi:hypothetical protein